MRAQLHFPNLFFLLAILFIQPKAAVMITYKLNLLIRSVEKGVYFASLT